MGMWKGKGAFLPLKSLMQQVCPRPARPVSDFWSDPAAGSCQTMSLQEEIFIICYSKPWSHFQSASSSVATHLGPGHAHCSAALTTACLARMRGPSEGQQSRHIPQQNGGSNWRGRRTAVTYLSTGHWDGPLNDRLHLLGVHGDAVFR